MAKIKAFFNRLTQAKRGNAVIEFALIFPTLVVVTLMIFDLGRALFIYTSVSNVAAEGARYAALHGDSNTFPKTKTEIEDYIRDQAAGLSDSDLTVTISYDPDIAYTGSDVTVRIDYEMGFFLSGVFSLIGGSLASTMTITGVTTMDVL